MPKNPHRGAPVNRFGAPLASARVAAILVHGRDQSPSVMHEAVVGRIGLGDVAYVAPEAEGRTWYPAGFMAEIAANEPRLGFALDRVAALSEALEAEGFPPSKQVLLGFSQGACLACESVYRRRRRFGALIAFTGGLIGPPGTQWTAETDAFRDMPVLLGGDRADPWVPAARMLDTAAVFQKLGARVAINLYASQGHVIGDEQIAHARAIFADV
jgi:phospholipase/carboxylesterase